MLEAIAKFFVWLFGLSSRADDSRRADFDSIATQWGSLARRLREELDATQTRLDTTEQTVERDHSEIVALKVAVEKCELDRAAQANEIENLKRRMTANGG